VGTYVSDRAWGTVREVVIKITATNRGPEPARLHVLPTGDHLADAGMGQVSELFDGDAPHTPRGGIAQAWSVAEGLRATTECRDGVTSQS
jgi:glycogen debranching enzyme